MQTKPLLFGLIGFFLGGLIASVAAMGFVKTDTSHSPSGTGEMLMSDMTKMLRDKRGDEYDKMFIEHMIEHHQAAVDMSRLSATNAKHDEIKKLSTEIIAAQEKEIQQMRDWQKGWGYSGTNVHDSHAGH